MFSVIFLWPIQLTAVSSLFCNVVSSFRILFSSDSTQYSAKSKAVCSNQKLKSHSNNFITGQNICAHLKPWARCFAQSWRLSSMLLSCMPKTFFSQTDLTHHITAPWLKLALQKPTCSKWLEQSESVRKEEWIGYGGKKYETIQQIDSLIANYRDWMLWGARRPTKLTWSLSLFLWLARNSWPYHEAEPPLTEYSCIGKDLRGRRNNLSLLTRAFLTTV